MFRLIYGFCTRFFSVHPAPVHHMLGPARLMILSPVETVSLLYLFGSSPFRIFLPVPFCINRVGCVCMSLQFQDHY